MGEGEGGGPGNGGVAEEVTERLAEASLSLHLSLCPGGEEVFVQQSSLTSTKTRWPESPSKDPTDTHLRARLPLSLAARGESATHF